MKSVCLNNRGSYHNLLRLGSWNNKVKMAAILNNI